MARRCLSIALNVLRHGMELKVTLLHRKRVDGKTFHCYRLPALSWADKCHKIIQPLRFRSGRMIGVAVQLKTCDYDRTILFTAFRKTASGVRRLAPRLPCKWFGFRARNVLLSVRKSGLVRIGRQRGCSSCRRKRFRTGLGRDGVQFSRSRSGTRRQGFEGWWTRRSRDCRDGTEFGYHRRCLRRHRKSRYVHQSCRRRRPGNHPGDGWFGRTLRRSRFLELLRARRRRRSKLARYLRKRISL